MYVFECGCLMSVCVCELWVRESIPDWRQVKIGTLPRFKLRGGKKRNIILWKAKSERNPKKEEHKKMKADTLWTISVGCHFTLFHCSLHGWWLAAGSLYRAFRCRKMTLPATVYVSRLIESIHLTSKLITKSDHLSFSVTPCHRTAHTIRKLRKRAMAYLVRSAI